MGAKEESARLQEEMAEAFERLDAEALRAVLKRWRGPAVKGLSLQGLMEEACSSPDERSLSCLKELIDWDGGALARACEPFPGVVFAAAQDLRRGPQKMRELARAGVNLPAIKCEGGSALHWVCKNGRTTVEMIRALAGLGLDVNALNEKGLTPMDVAIRGSSAQVASVLSELGGRFQTESGLHWARFTKTPGMLELITALHERERLSEAAAPGRSGAKGAL